MVVAQLVEHRDVAPEVFAGSSPVDHPTSSRWPSGLRGASSNLLFGHKLEFSRYSVDFIKIIIKRRRTRG